MKIAILTLGTRGDVQPYAILGKALQDRGHNVTLATAKNFESLVLSYGIDFVAVQADFQEILASDDGKKMLKGNIFAVKKNLNTWIFPLIKDSLGEFYSLALKSDKVIYHVKTLADCFADQFPEKMIRASVIPLTEPTTEFANPSFSGLWVPKFLFKLSYTLANLSIKLLHKPIGRFRKEYNLPKRFTTPPVKNIYGISSHLLAMPKDYSNRSTFTGFWFGQSGNDLSQELLKFLADGEPPVVITFGSMPFECKFDLQQAVLKLTTEFNIRVVVIRGWGLENTYDLENCKNIKVVNSAPYEKLFPEVRAIIHHGGIGTTAECLRAGKPFFICPILYPIGDQLFWGHLTYKKGLAVKPVPLKKLTEQLFFQRVHQLLTNEQLYRHAKSISALLEIENGLENAVAEVENI